MDEVRRRVLRLFCQHCQALRKTFGWETEEVCWYERWFDEDSAICASAQDAAKAILAIPAIAIVDREAELPPMPYGRASALNPVQQNYSNKFRKQGYSRAQVEMLKAGWVKEKSKPQPQQAEAMAGDKGDG